jgi:hypothetical protein
VSADQGFWAELRVAAVQVDNPFNAPLPDLRAGWRFTNEWSVGVTYGPWRVLDYDMRVLNDVISGPVMLSSLGAVGSFHFMTHAAWGGRVSLQAALLNPDLGVAEPGDDMSGALAETLLDVSYGYVGDLFSFQAFANAGWMFGSLENGTHEGLAYGTGPDIVDRLDVSAPAAAAGLAVSVWF